VSDWRTVEVCSSLLAYVAHLAGEEVLALSEDTLATCHVQWPLREARLEVAAQVAPYTAAPSTRQVGVACLSFGLLFRKKIK